jgi:hypothetical protein
LHRRRASLWHVDADQVVTRLRALPRKKKRIDAATSRQPDGFWEHLGFVRLNDELLNELGGAWDLPPKRDENFADTRLDPLRMKGRLLIERFNSTNLWGWKDRRNCLTLPFWQRLSPKIN